MVKNHKLEKPIRKFLKPSFSIALLFFLLLFVSCTYIISDHDDYTWKCPSCPRHPLNITTLPPTTTPTNISDVVFGVAGSSATWERRSSYVSLWWDPLTMRGNVWLDRHASSPDSARCPEVRISKADFLRFGARAVSSRIAYIVADSYSLHGDNARWFVMGDDDTIFFKDNLVSMLNKYDHNEMYYIGAQSESVEQDVMHSYEMAFGGGGFAVSVAAAREVSVAMDGCLERYFGFYGSDERVHACFAEIGVPLTREPGFHQVDLRGDAYGMLAAHPISPLISLHHLDSIEPIFPFALTQLEALQSLIHASKHDSARTLQQTFCHVLDRAFNWSVSVSWGYTVQIYPYILPPAELAVPLQTFSTWHSYKDGPFLFNTRPVRLDQECEGPVRFFFDRVQNSGEMNGTMTEYLRYKPKNGRGCGQAGFREACKVRLVRVMAKQMDQYVWQKAPRRQCCETRRINRGKILEVKIRDCYPGEITSPP